MWRKELSKRIHTRAGRSQSSTVQDLGRKRTPMQIRRDESNEPWQMQVAKRLQLAKLGRARRGGHWARVSCFQVELDEVFMQVDPCGPTDFFRIERLSLYLLIHRCWKLKHRWRDIVEVASSKSNIPHSILVPFPSYLWYRCAPVPHKGRNTITEWMPASHSVFGSQESIPLHGLHSGPRIN